MDEGYETVNEAVYYAAQAAREIFGNKAEAIALVYEKDGRFFFTQPANERQMNDKHVRARFRIPKGSLRFVVHNHPEGHENEKFSQNDIETAERLGVPSAIIFGPAAPTIRVFTPGVTEKRQERTKGAKQAPLWSAGDEFAGTMQ